MDSLRLGLFAVIPPDPEAARRARNRTGREEARVWQERVLRWISEKKLHDRDIAAAIGVHPRSVAGVLTGRAQLPKAWIKPLSRLLDVTADELRAAWRPWRKVRKSIPILTPKEEHVRQLIADLLAERRVRQADLARAVGTKQSCLSLVVNGLKRVPECWYPRIAEYFDISEEKFHPPNLPHQEHSTGTAPRQRKRYPPSLTPQEERVRLAIARLLSVSGLSQRDLARAVGLQQPDVSRIINGKQRALAHWYPAIADFFGVSADLFA